MCPDKKLKWFKDHGHSAAQIRDIKNLLQPLKLLEEAR
jgi:hypothetical protein